MRRLLLARVAAVAAVVTVGICSAARAEAQEMVVSFYEDAWTSGDYSTPYTIVDAEDLTSGCNHWGYGIEIHLSGSSGSDWNSGQGMSVGTSLPNYGGGYDITSSLSFNCECGVGPFWAGSSTQVQVPPQCGDERGSIIEEYVSRGVNLQPSCSDFTTTASSTHFVPAEYDKNGYHQNYIARSSLLSGAEATRTNYGAALVVTNSYRCPDKQCDINCSAIGGGRHMHGDAIDFNSYSNTSTWDAIKNAADAVGGSCIEPMSLSSNSHVHVDFRPSCPW